MFIEFVVWDQVELNEEPEAADVAVDGSILRCSLSLMFGPSGT